MAPPSPSLPIFLVNISSNIQVFPRVVDKSRQTSISCVGIPLVLEATHQLCLLDVYSFLGCLSLIKAVTGLYINAFPGSPLIFIRGSWMKIAKWHFMMSFLLVSLSCFLAAILNDESACFYCLNEPFLSLTISLLMRTDMTAKSFDYTRQTHIRYQQDCITSNINDNSK